MVLPQALVLAKLGSGFLGTLREVEEVEVDLSRAHARKSIHLALPLEHPVVVRPDQLDVCALLVTTDVDLLSGFTRVALHVNAAQTESRVLVERPCRGQPREGNEFVITLRRVEPADNPLPADITSTPWQPTLY